MKLPALSSQEIIKILRKAGFDFAPKRGKGSHTALFRQDEKGRELLVIVPKMDMTPKGVILSILQQANLSREEFVKLLKRPGLTRQCSTAITRLNECGSVEISGLSSSLQLCHRRLAGRGLGRRPRHSREARRPTCGNPEERGNSP